ncbi:MAG: nucleotidyltransferase domain-containing protein [Chloroflexi bacterium]|nr:nucleotidyltransferase domain-containing protein [Chloroflexota bacterium]
MIDISPAQLVEVRQILNRHVPGSEVRAFGSRVTGRTKPWSDLDLAVVGPEPIGWQNVEILKEAFQESTLPFRVDVLDWHETSPSFQAIIAQQYAVIQASEHIGAV